MQVEKTINRNGKMYKIVLVEGWDKPQVLEASKVLLKHIIETKGKHITYGEFCKKLSFEAYPEFVDKLFGPICYSCLESGLPPASAIVVNKDEMIPGEGFIKAYYPHIKDKDLRLVKCLEVMKEVQDFPDWDIMLEAMCLL